MEQELIKVEINSNNEKCVSGKELHKVLEIGTRFDTWFNRMCEYGFVANVDFTPMLKIVHDPITKKDREVLDDYVVKLDMAKEIAMIQRTEKGKQVRLYFIEIEKKYNNIEKEDLLLLNVVRAESKEQISLALNEYRTQIVIPLKTELKETQQKLQYKQEVINGLSEDTKLQTQRQFLVEIICAKSKNPQVIKDRWNLLYDFYDKVKHIRVRARCEGYNLKQKKKKDQLSVLGYIDEQLGDIPTLYQVAVKLFESDIKDRLQKYMEAL